MLVLLLLTIPRKHTYQDSLTHTASGLLNLPEKYVGEAVVDPPGNECTGRQRIGFRERKQLT